MYRYLLNSQDTIQRAPQQWIEGIYCKIKASPRFFNSLPGHGKNAKILPASTEILTMSPGVKSGSFSPPLLSWEILKLSGAAGWAVAVLLLELSTAAAATAIFVSKGFRPSDLMSVAGFRLRNSAFAADIFLRCSLRYRLRRRRHCVFVRTRRPFTMASSRSFFSSL